MHNKYYILGMPTCALGSEMIFVFNNNNKLPFIKIQTKKQIKK